MLLASTHSQIVFLSDLQFNFHRAKFSVWRAKAEELAELN